MFDLEQVRHRHEGQEWVPHWHDEWSFGAVIKGECRCSVAGHPLVTRAGDLIAIAPGTVHTGVLAARSQRAGVLVVMLYVPAAWLQHQRLTLPARSGSIRAPSLARRARDLQSIDDVQAWLRTAVPSVSRALRPRAHASQDPVPTEAVRALIGHVRSAVLAGELRVSGLARQCGVSRERIHKVIRHWIGMSPSDYLRAARLHRAKDLLVSGEPVASVAAACGFADQAHFTRWFRRAFGYTPGDLQQAIGRTANGICRASQTVR